MCIILGNIEKPIRSDKGKSLLNFVANYTLVDLETTGLSPMYDSILEVSAIKVRENKIIELLVDGFALHEAARLLKMPRAAAESCMESFCFRARAAIG